MDSPDVEYKNKHFDLEIPCNQVLTVGKMRSNKDTTYVNMTPHQ